MLFRLCEEFVASGVSTVLDLTMGWEVQWQQVDSIIRRHPQTLFLPIILRCPYDQCIERTWQRYAANPAYYDPPDYYTTQPKVARIWQFLTRLDRPDVRFIDAEKPHDKVYHEILKHVSTQLARGFEPRKVEEKMNRTQFIETLDRERTEWDALLAQIPTQRLTELGAAGDWTIKDIIAHVTWHEREIVGLLQGRTLLTASQLWNLAQDERNEAIYDQNKDRSPEEVVEEAREAYRELRSLIAGISEEELIDPSKFEGIPADWVPWNIIAGNTFWHYQLHGADIRAWLESATRASS